MAEPINPNIPDLKWATEDELIAELAARSESLLLVRTKECDGKVGSGDYRSLVLYRNATAHEAMGLAAYAERRIYDLHTREGRETNPRQEEP